MTQTQEKFSDTPVVMIVDDDESTRMIANEFLSQSGFRVVEAGDGLEALNQITNINPDLLLLDVEMPGMNGFDLCRELRASQQFAYLPILMLTGLDNNESIDLAYDAGATDFAAKPVNWTLLCHRLKYMLRSSMAEQKIHKLAFYDSLTGLANRTLFKDRLLDAVRNAKANSSLIAVIYFDLDDFKRVNDIFGHAIGDKLLKEIGQRISARVASADLVGSSVFQHMTVARMGGDEFTLLLDKLDSEETAIKVAESLMGIFAEPFVLNGNTLFSSPSVGISMFPRDGQSGETLMVNADMAMYEAKNIGKNVYRFHNSDRDKEIRRRHALSDRMHTALLKGLFSLNYQPQMDLHSGKIFSAEALLRWHDEELGDISPVEFIPIAEENGLIVPLGEWVMRSACAQAKSWTNDNFAIRNVAINISVLQFMQAGFADMVAAVLQSTRLAPVQLELEITESVLASDISNAADNLRKLKSIGVALSIDDFGTGYSSLNQLKHFPIDRLKIDRSFIGNVTINHEDAAITRAVIAMAKSMKIKVLAEGVESIDHLQFLRDNGCDEIQGYWLSRPLSAEQLGESITKLELLAAESGVNPIDSEWKKTG